MSEKIPKEVQAVIDFFAWLIRLIVRALETKPAVKIHFKFGGKEMSSVALAIVVGQSAKFFITGTDANGVRTGSLAAGASLSVLSSNTTDLTITPDATPQAAPDGGPSIASGSLSALAAGSVSLSAQVKNADGSAGPAANATVTITPAQAGPAAAITFQFGTPAATPPTQ